MSRHSKQLNQTNSNNSNSRVTKNSVSLPRTCLTIGNNSPIEPIANRIHYASHSLEYFHLIRFGTVNRVVREGLTGSVVAGRIAAGGVLFVDGDAGAGDGEGGGGGGVQGSDAEEDVDVHFRKIVVLSDDASLPAVGSLLLFG